MDMVSILKRIDGLAFFALAALSVTALLMLGRAPGAGDLFVPPWDKVAHITVFGGLAFLVVSGFRGARLLLCFSLVVLAGAVDEAQQWFIPGRHADWGDLGADIFAAATGVMVTQAIWRRDERNGR